MQVIKRLCFCVAAVLFSLMLLLPVMGAQTTPQVQTPEVQESSAFIELQIENFSLESGRNAAHDMLLGTVTSLSGKQATQLLVEATPKPLGLSFSWAAAGFFALVLTAVAATGFVLYKVRHKIPTP